MCIESRLQQYIHEQWESFVLKWLLDFTFWEKEGNWQCFFFSVWINRHKILPPLYLIHTLCVHYAHTAANLNSGYSNNAKEARVHYLSTIALRTPLRVRERSVGYIHARRTYSFTFLVIIFCMLSKNLSGFASPL